MYNMSWIDLWTFVDPLWKSVHLLCYFLTMIYKKVRIEGGGVWWLKALLENIEVLFVYVIYGCALSTFLFNQLPLYQTSGMPYYTEYVTCRLIKFYFFFFSSICVSMYALALYTPLPATLTPHPWNLKFFTLFMLEGWFRSEHCWKPQSPCLF